MGWRVPERASVSGAVVGMVTMTRELQTAKGGARLRTERLTRTASSVYSTSSILSGRLGTTHRNSNGSSPVASYQ